MPAEFQSGFFVRQAAWHGLGEVLPDYLDLTTPEGVKYAMGVAGQDWTLEEVPVYAGGQEVPGFKGLKRSDNGVVIHVAPSTYGVVNNSLLWDLTKALADQPDVKVDTAGVLYDGKKVWVLAEVGDPWQVDGDPSPMRQRICVATSHDGTLPVAAFETTERVVCANTFGAAWATAAREKAFVYKFRHTTHAEKRVREVVAMLEQTRVFTEEFRAAASALATVPVLGSKVDEYVEAFIPAPAPTPGKEVTDRMLDNTLSAREKWFEFYQSETCDGIRGTAWGVFNASTEWVDYGKSRRGSNKEENLFKDTYLGGSDLAKKKALDLVLEMV